MTADPEHPCLPTLVITPCRPTPCGPDGCVVIRCGNCGTDAHWEELSAAEFSAYIEEHCATSGDNDYA